MALPGSNDSRFSENEYASFRAFLEQACGILLGENKNYLIDSRLRNLFRDNELNSLQSLVAAIQAPGSGQLRQQVIDAMTTNETLWFRDKHPFEFFANELLPMFAKQKSSINIWCAACSTGQEPYSLSICVEEFKQKSFGLANVPVKIVATDISSRVIEQCRLGVYDAISLKRGLGDQRLQKNFTACGEGSWVINNNIKSRIDFRPINLKDSYYNLGKFDVVFCRNVLIYFSSDLQKQIITRIHQALNPGGYLFLGGSETPKGVNDLFDVKYYTPGVVYLRK